MDYIRKTQEEGYRLNDLSPENRVFARGYRLAIQHLTKEVFAYKADAEQMYGGTLGKAYGELIEKVGTELHDRLVSNCAELQVGLAEPGNGNES